MISCGAVVSAMRRSTATTFIPVTSNGREDMIPPSGKFFHAHGVMMSYIRTIAFHPFDRETVVRGGSHGGRFNAFVMRPSDQIYNGLAAGSTMISPNAIAPARARKHARAISTAGCCHPDAGAVEKSSPEPPQLRRTKRPGNQQRRIAHPNFGYDTFLVSSAHFTSDRTECEHGRLRTAD